MVWTCNKCGIPVFSGKTVYFTDKYGEPVDDGIKGEYFNGGGTCDCCGAVLCGECAEWYGSICDDCQEWQQEQKYGKSA